MGIRLADFILAGMRARGESAELIDAKVVGLPMLDRMYKEYPRGGAPPAIQLTTPPTGLRVASLISPFSWTNGRDFFTGELLSAAYERSSNGPIDFYYQITNTFTGRANGQDTLLSTFHLLTLNGRLPGFAVPVFQIEGTAFGFGSGADNLTFSGNTTDHVASVSCMFRCEDLTVNLEHPLAPGESSSVLVLAAIGSLASGGVTWRRCCPKPARGFSRSSRPKRTSSYARRVPPPDSR